MARSSSLNGCGAWHRARASRACRRGDRV